MALSLFPFSFTFFFFFYHWPTCRKLLYHEEKNARRIENWMIDMMVYVIAKKPEIACAWVEDSIVRWALHSLPWLPLHFSQFHVRLTIGLCRESDSTRPQLMTLLHFCRIRKESSAQDSRIYGKFVSHDEIR